MEYKIYIVEDQEEIYRGYHRKIQSLKTNYDISIVSASETRQLKFSEFEKSLKIHQPDIIFLDYELWWEDGQCDAPNVVHAIIKQYDKHKFPPIIILNTMRKELQQEIYNLLNYSTKRISYPREFLFSISAETLEKKDEQIVDILNQCFVLLQEDRAYYEWPAKVNHYLYPSLEDVSTYSLANPEFLSERHWLKPENTSLPPLVNGKNLLLMTAGTTLGPVKKSKIGSILYLDAFNGLQKGLFTFPDQRTLDAFFYGTGKLSPFIKSKSVYFNNQFFSNNLLNFFKLTFRENANLAAAYFSEREKELLACNCTSKKHPFYSSQPIKA